MIDGRIDRVDYAEIEGKGAALLFDYKTKPRSVSWAKMYYGLDIQLVLYMLALVGGGVVGGKKIDTVAGAFYLPIEAPVSKGSFNDSGIAKEKFNYKAKGIFNGVFAKQLDSATVSGSSPYYNYRMLKKDMSPYGDYTRSGALKPGDFEGFMDLAKSHISQLAEGIVSGWVDIAPYRLGKESPCSFCDYQALCRFDWQINDYNMLSPMNKQQVIDDAGGGDGD